MSKKTNTKKIVSAVEEFSFDKMNNLHDNGKLKDHLDCKNYILKYFTPTKNGTHILIENDTMEIIQKDTFKEVYLLRFPKLIKLWYNTKTTPKRVICDIHKPRVGGDYINVASQKKYTTTKPYKVFDDKVKAKVDIMLDYIKLIWANSDKDVNEYILSWLANMVRGNKNQSCIYAKGDEGIGKSTLPDFIREFVIGTSLWAKGKSDHLMGQHNLGLLGKLFVTFEELQFFSEREWRGIDSELKDMITDTYMSYCDKYEKRFTAESFCNYMVLTNFNSIKGANGRRYLCVDINPSKMNDFKYFENLRSNCFNDEVGYAFYCMLCDRDLTKYKSNEIPSTQSKKDLCADLLSPLEKFLKCKFLLKKLAIKDVKIKDMFEMYEKYMKAHNYAEVTPNSLTKSMRELGFEYTKNNKYNFYRISLEELETVATRKKWRNDLDQDMLDEDEEDPYENGVEPNDAKVKHVLKSEFDLLKEKYEKLLQLQHKDEVSDTDEKPKKKSKSKKVTSILVADNAIAEAVSSLWNK